MQKRIDRAAMRTKLITVTMDLARRPPVKGEHTRKGVAAYATVGQVAEAAKCSRSTVFAVFDSVYALEDACRAQVLASLDDAPSTTALLMRIRRVPLRIPFQRRITAWASAATTSADRQRWNCDAPPPEHQHGSM